MPVKYKVRIKGGSIGDQFWLEKYRAMVFDSKEEARELADRVRKRFSPTERRYYNAKVSVTQERVYERKCREGRNNELIRDT